MKIVRGESQPQAGLQRSLEARAWSGLWIHRQALDLMGAMLGRLPAGMRLNRSAEVRGDGALERSESELGTSASRLERAKRNIGTVRERRFAS
jgi:hypothetical protein